MPLRHAVLPVLVALLVGLGPPGVAGAGSGPEAEVEAGVGAGVVAGSAAERRPQLPEPRGVSAWRAPGTGRNLRRSGASWVYDWSVDPGFRVPRRVRFVPMVWNDAAATPEALAAASRYGPDLLGPNEPDRDDQAAMSVDEALALWPALQATGLRLGSPAVSAHADVAGGWLDRFVRGAEAQGLRVDFIAVHWYGSDFRAGRATRQLRDYLVAVHERYQRPVWLTEYALIDFAADRYPTPAAQARFVRRSTRVLDRLPWLERYAWFSLPAPARGPSTGLYRPDGTPTAAGRAYRRP